MSNTLEQSSPTLKPATKPISKKAPLKKRTLVQEKVMLLLTFFFVGGVVIYSVMPEGALRGSSIGVFSILMTYLLFKYGI